MTSKLNKRMARYVAQAIANVNQAAGQPLNEPIYRPVAWRAARLLAVGEYGAYIRAGDPHGWGGGGGAVATIYAEPHGGPDDCGLPCSYYESYCVPLWAMTWMREKLGLYVVIEWQNAAVLSVYQED